MQLNLETDYGIRCMLFLAEAKRCVTSVEMTEKLGFHTVEHTQKILRKLRDGGLVKVKLGSNGGYMLARDASEISVLEVLKAMEETICINRCLEQVQHDIKRVNRLSECLSCMVEAMDDEIEEMLSWAEANPSGMHLVGDENK